MEPTPPRKPEGQRVEKTQDAAANQLKTPKANPSRRRRRNKTLRLVLLYFLALSLLAALPVLLWGWRYVAEQLNRMRILFGEPTFLLLHLSTFLAGALGPWLLRKHRADPKAALNKLTYVLVVIVLLINTWNVTTASRHLVAQRAGEMCDESFTYVHSQLNTTPRATSDLVILDQGITKVMSYTYVIVRNEFPEFDLRTTSLHMVPDGNHGDEVWDVIQEGSQRKDREFMSYPTDSNPTRTSLVGQTIKEMKFKYCRDIARPERGGEDCKTFQAPPSGESVYNSLICFPLETGLGTPVFASICFDSKFDHAFDGKELRLRARIDKQMSQLSGLLDIYRGQNRFIFKDSQPEGKPPAR
jgi:hypothetical protein